MRLIGFKLHFEIVPSSTFDHISKDCGHTQ